MFLITTFFVTLVLDGQWFEYSDGFVKVLQVLYINFKINILNTFSTNKIVVLICLNDNRVHTGNDYQEIPQQFETIVTQTSLSNVILAES